MRLTRSLPGVLAAVLWVALIGGVPARGAARIADPQATTVTGACLGGPGRLSLTVHPPADGRYRVEVTARGLAEGSSWTAAVNPESNPEGEGKAFRRVAVDGGWTITTQFPVEPDPRGDVFFSVSADNRGDRDHTCFMINQPTSPTVGYSWCNKPLRFIYLVPRELDNGSTVIRSFMNPRPADSKWHLTLTATGETSRQRLEFDDRVGRDGLVRSRVVITGVDNPRLRLLATTKSRSRCFIGVDPPNETAGASLNMQGLNGRFASVPSNG